jgi:hypothetical protein
LEVIVLEVAFAEIQVLNADCRHPCSWRRY